MRLVAIKDLRDGLVLVGCERCNINGCQNSLVIYRLSLQSHLLCKRGQLRPTATGGPAATWGDHSPPAEYSSAGPSLMGIPGSVLKLPPAQVAGWKCSNIPQQRWAEPAMGLHRPGSQRICHPQSEQRHDARRDAGQQGKRRQRAAISLERAAEHQRWRMQGSQIINVNSDKCLDMAYKSRADGGNVNQAPGRQPKLANRSLVARRRAEVRCGVYTRCRRLEGKGESE
jgi:hypothetical protein